MADQKPDITTDLSLWCYLHPKEAAALIREAEEVIRPFASVAEHHKDANDYQAVEVILKLCRTAQTFLARPQSEKR